MTKRESLFDKAQLVPSMLEGSSLKPSGLLLAGKGVRRNLERSRQSFLAKGTKNCRTFFSFAKLFFYIQPFIPFIYSTRATFIGEKMDVSLKAAPDVNAPFYDDKTSDFILDAQMQKR